MLFGESACYGESLGLQYKNVIDEVNENSLFKMRSDLVESRLMDRPSEAASAEDENELVSHSWCCD